MMVPKLASPSPPTLNLNAVDVGTPACRKKYVGEPPRGEPPVEHCQKILVALANVKRAARRSTFVNGCVLKEGCCLDLLTPDLSRECHADYLRPSQIDALEAAPVACSRLDFILKLIRVLDKGDCILRRCC